MASGDAGASGDALSGVADLASGPLATATFCDRSIQNKPRPCVTATSRSSIQNNSFTETFAGPWLVGHHVAPASPLANTPTSVANFKTDVWYYINRKAERVAFFEEKVTEQKILAVRFNEAGIVEEIESYNLEDGRKIEPVERISPTRGKELTMIEQLFGNIGRFQNTDGAGQ